MHQINKKSKNFNSKRKQNFTHKNKVNIFSSLKSYTEKGAKMASYRTTNSFWQLNTRHFLNYWIIFGSKIVELIHTKKQIIIIRDSHNSASNKHKLWDQWFKEKTVGRVNKTHLSQTKLRFNDNRLKSAAISIKYIFGLFMLNKCFFLVVNCVFDWEGTWKWIWWALQTTNCSINKNWSPIDSSKKLLI